MYRPNQPPALHPIGIQPNTSGLKPLPIPPKGFGQQPSMLNPNTAIGQVPNQL